jgi:hypothetical protein
VVTPQRRELTLDPLLAGPHVRPNGSLCRVALAVGVERILIASTAGADDMKVEHARVAAD